MKLTYMNDSVRCRAVSPGSAGLPAPLLPYRKGQMHVPRRKGKNKKIGKIKSGSKSGPKKYSASKKKERKERRKDEGWE
jgi:hypothetical protein